MTNYIKFLNKIFLIKGIPYRFFAISKNQRSLAFKQIFEEEKGPKYFQLDLRFSKARQHFQELCFNTMIYNLNLNT